MLHVATGIQLIDRLLLIFMPNKYQPDYMYLRNVRTKRVHFFTFFQVLCLAALWVIKSFKVSSGEGFPNTDNYRISKNLIIIVYFVVFFFKKFG